MTETLIHSNGFINLYEIGLMSDHPRSHETNGSLDPSNPWEFLQAIRKVAKTSHDPTENFQHLQPWKLTASLPLKNDGCKKTILSCWVLVTFQGVDSSTCRGCMPIVMQKNQPRNPRNPILAMQHVQPRVVGLNDLTLVVKPSFDSEKIVGKTTWRIIPIHG